MSLDTGDNQQELPHPQVGQPDSEAATATSNHEEQDLMVTEPPDASHHKNAVVPEIQDTVTTDSQESDAVLPMVCVNLTESVRIAPRYSIAVPVHMEDEWSKTDPLLLQQDEELLSLRLSTDDALLQLNTTGRSHAVLTLLSASNKETFSVKSFKYKLSKLQVKLHSPFLEPSTSPDLSDPSPKKKHSGRRN